MPVIFIYGIKVKEDIFEEFNKKAKRSLDGIEENTGLRVYFSGDRHVVIGKQLDSMNTEKAIEDWEKETKSKLQSLKLDMSDLGWHRIHI